MAKAKVFVNTKLPNKLPNTISEPYLSSELTSAFIISGDPFAKAINVKAAKVWGTLYL